MRIWEFENAVWDLDGVRIVVRGEAGDEVGDYAFTRAAAGNSTFRELIETRLRPRIGDRVVFAINGSGEIAHGATHLDTIKASYA